MSDKPPDCYTCKYRREIPGDAHSECKHPSRLVGATLQVKGHRHGVRMGWFYWPINFDPVWLLECNGHTPKETVGDPMPESS